MALLSLLKQLLDELNTNLYLTIFCIIISILFVLKLTTRRNNYINLPPSPPKLPIIGNLHQLGTLPHRSFQALSKKHGPLMLLQLGQTPTLVVSSADVAKDIIKNHDVVFSSRPQSTAANIFLYGCKDVGFAPYGEEWRQKRKVCVLELLSIKRVKSFQSIREEEVAELVNTVRASEGSRVNLSEMLIATSNNIVSRCILGQKYDTPDGSSSFGELGRKLMRQLTAFCVGDFFPSLGWVDVVVGQIPSFKDTFAGLEAFFDDVVAQHKMRMKRKDDNCSDDRKDFVDILLQLQERDMLDFELTGEDLKAILVDMFIGGSDTTSTTLEWTFAELIKSPNTMKKAQDEVSRVVGSKSKVDENDVNQMNYLKCVIKETLRLHPPLPLLVPRETTASARVKGYDIPPKTRVYLNVWAIQRDPELWDNPEEFIPERYDSNQVDYKGQDFQLIPFGTGRRGCPGISFGLASVEYALANLLYWFNWKLPVGDIDMSEMYGLTVSKKVQLHLGPIPYSSLLDL